MTCTKHPYRGYTADELQQQYGARAAVPEHPAIFERWRAQSAAWRADAPAARLDLAYGERPRQRVDLFHPDGRHSAPLHVFFHGGYWQAMDRDDFSFVARALNARGIAVAVTGYSLCPEVTLADIVDEARDAIAWLHTHRQDLALEPGPVQVSGHSAGGQLAAMLAATDARRLGAKDESHPIGWIAPISGVFDLEPLIHTALNDALRLDLGSARAVSPIHLSPAGSPAIDAWVGADESDEFRRQSDDFVRVWRGEGAAHRVAGCNHFTVLDALFADDGPLVRRAAHGA